MIFFLSSVDFVCEMESLVRLDVQRNLLKRYKDNIFFLFDYFSNRLPIGLTKLKNLRDFNFSQNPLPAEFSYVTGAERFLIFD